MDDFKLEKIDGGHEDFLRDESRKRGSACSISFPTTEAEVAATLSYMSQNGVKVTVQGARTGVAAGAVPAEGHILSMGRMDRVTGLAYDAVSGSYLVSLQPGVILSKLREMLAEKSFDTSGWSVESLRALEAFQKSGGWFFPTDPTETSATLGGIAACNSSGACSFYYGPARNYIAGMDVVLSDGSVLRLSRGMGGISGGSFSVASTEGRVFHGSLPGYEMPAVKNASGYFAHEGMDLLDLFIGSEGTLGVITGITLRLLPRPAFVWGMTALLREEAQALAYVRRLRESPPEGSRGPGAPVIAALEYFNHDTLKLLRRFKLEKSSFGGMPDIPGDIASAVYAEIHAETEDDACSLVMEATAVLEECGGSEDATWFASNAAEMEKLHVFRHAAPEAVNLIIAERKKRHPELTKLGTDMAVPDEGLEEVMDMYNRDLEAEGLESVIFGHIGNNHLHVNILPRSAEEYEKGWRLYHDWAQRIIGMGGTISAEHGVGKLKTALLARMYGKEGIRQMKAIKKVFDPNAVLSPGNLFAD
jgi:D-lactate dehydrogenase (cytochrome)